MLVLDSFPQDVSLALPKETFSANVMNQQKQRPHLGHSDDSVNDTASKANRSASSSSLQKLASTPLPSMASGYTDIDLKHPPLDQSSYRHTLDTMDTDKMDLRQYAKQYTSTLTFPEKLMIVLIHVEKSTARHGRSNAHSLEPIGWTNDGLSFVVRDKERLVRDLLPQFAFPRSKFDSFVRYVSVSVDLFSAARAVL
jgi:hypothetical protein